MLLRPFEPVPLLPLEALSPLLPLDASHSLAPDSRSPAEPRLPLRPFDALLPFLPFDILFPLLPLDASHSLAPDSRSPAEPRLPLRPFEADFFPAAKPSIMMSSNTAMASSSRFSAFLSAADSVASASCSFAAFKPLEALLPPSEATRTMVSGA